MPQRLLLFTLAGHGFALDLEEVSEVMEPQPSYPIPRAPAHVLGLMNFHGALTALVDLKLYLGYGGRSRSGGKVLVLDTRVASLAVWVDGVSSVVTEEVVTARTPQEDELTPELLHTEQDSYRLLKLEPLLGALELELTGFLPPGHAPQGR